MIEERLDRLRQLIDQKNGPRVHAYVEDKVHYEGQLVTHEGSTYQALCDTGRAPPDEEHWIQCGKPGQEPPMRASISWNTCGSPTIAVVLRA